MRKKQHTKHRRESSDRTKFHTPERSQVEEESKAPRVTTRKVSAPAPVIENHTSGAIVYGVAPTLEALRAGSRSIERILITEGRDEHRVRELLLLARAGGVPVRRAARVELDRITTANHQGVVAIVSAARYLDADELLNQLAARGGTDDPPLAVALYGVEDPRNVGAIIRTAECAGAHGIFLPERRAAGLTETVAKTAAGALEYVPVARAGNVVRLLEELKARNIWTIGTAADAKHEYTDWDFTGACALVFGGEGAGLRRLVAERCDALVSIPLRGRIESLNVSVAAGILLYEVLRQRTEAKRRTYKDVREAAEDGSDGG